MVRVSGRSLLCQSEIDRLVYKNEKPEAHALRAFVCAAGLFRKGTFNYPGSTGGGDTEGCLRCRRTSW